MWKISPGKGASQWEIWRQEGRIGIGWVYPKYVEDLHEFEDIQTLTQAFADAKDPRPHYAAEQCWTFCNEIKVGDIVVAYGHYTTLDIGRVEGGYRFIKGDFEENQRLFLHRRRVRWFQIGPIQLTDENIKKFMRQEKTVFQITDKATISLVNDLLQRNPEYSFVERTREEVRRVLGPEIRVEIEPTKHLEMEIELAKRKFALLLASGRMDVDGELKKVKFEKPPERIHYSGLVRVLRSTDILAPTNLERIQVAGQVVYLPPKTDIKNVDMSLAQECQNFVYNILQPMTSPEFATNMIGISFEELYRDAHRFGSTVLFNANHYSKNKSMFYWLFTCAREAAYLIHKRRDEKHMKIMRELVVRALEKLVKKESP